MLNDARANPFKATQLDFKRTIKRLARRALKNLRPDSPAFKEAWIRKNKPMDYLRCVEFPLSYQLLSLGDNMKVLDLASPQWFSLFLAHRFPRVEFVYTNILESELRQIKDIAACLGLKNISYRVEDGRHLSFTDEFFDRAVSISTIEHIAPDIGGDTQALGEIRRVLKKGGEFTLSVPLKKERSLVYDSLHPVWERETQQKNFYMRNYDLRQVEELAQNTGFTLLEKLLMFERPGLFAMEYWESEGRHRKEKDGVIKLKKKIDKLIGLRLESILATRYIRVEAETTSQDRLINLVAKLLKK